MAESKGLSSCIRGGIAAQFSLRFTSSADASWHTQMGDGGDGAEVVDERLWSEEDKAAGKDGMPEEKYEKGAAVQTKPEDDLEFRGADEADEADKAPEPADKTSDEQQDDKRDKRKEQAAEEAPGDVPINALEPDSVEEAHGIQPEGADAEDALPEQEELLELPQDLGLGGEDGDADDVDGEPGADEMGGEGDDGKDADDADGHLVGDEEPGDDDMEHDGDAGAEQGEAMPLNPDSGDAGAAPDVDQGAPAGSNGCGGSSALDAPQPAGQTPGLPAPARDEHGAHAAAAAGIAPGQLEATAMDEGGERAELPDSAADAMNAGGGTGGGGGSGEASGGATGATAPADKPSAGAAARSAPQSSLEPNPYRNLGDALQSWRDRLSVRARCPRCVCALGARPACSSPTDVTHFLPL